MIQCGVTVGRCMSSKSLRGHCPPVTDSVPRNTADPTQLPENFASHSCAPMHDGPLWIRVLVLCQLFFFVAPMFTCKILVFSHRCDVLGTRKSRVVA